MPLHDLHVTDSSEAILSGRKPPFRLLVRALLPHNGPKLNIRHAVSEGFVVGNMRTTDNNSIHSLQHAVFTVWGSAQAVWTDLRCILQEERSPMAHAVLARAGKQSYGSGTRNMRRLPRAARA